MSYSSYLRLCYDMSYFYGPVLSYYLRKVLYQQRQRVSHDSL
jgi:hypothetical protein